MRKDEPQRQARQGRGRRARYALVIAAALAFAAGIPACKNPLAAGAKLIKDVAASPLTVVVVKGGSAVANGSTLDFGEVSIAASKDVTLTITNQGKVPLNLDLGSVATTGTDKSLFSFVSLPPARLAAQASAEFTLRFSPDTVGLKNANVLFSSNDVSNKTFSIALSGTGTQKTPTPVILDGSRYQCFPSGHVNVTLACSVPAKIYYTTDKSEPSIAMLGLGTFLYTAPFAFTFGSSYSMIRCMAIADGYKTSDTAVAEFSTTDIKAPKISVGSRTFYPADTIPTFTITSPTNGVAIVFTIDGTVPNPSATSEAVSPITTEGLSYLMTNGGSFSYEGPHTNGASFILKAVAYATGAPVSDTTEADYVFKLSTPTFPGVQPLSTYYGTAQSVTLATISGSGGTATIHYSTGAVSSSSPAYSTAITVPAGAAGSSNAVTIQAMATQDNWQDSDILSGTFHVAGPGIWGTSLWDQASWQ